MKELRYSLTASGFVSGMGYENYDYPYTGQEPFTPGDPGAGLWQMTAEGWRSNAILAIAENWAGTHRDYKQAREAMKLAVAAQGGYPALTGDEKRVAAEWRALPGEQVSEVLTLEERVSSGVPFDTNSAASRKARFDYAKSYLYSILSKQDGDRVVGTILGFGLMDLYITYGQEGTMKTNYKGDADGCGLFDFVTGTAAAVEKFGCRMVDLITDPLEGVAAQQVVDRCIDILDRGNY